MKTSASGSSSSGPYYHHGSHPQHAFRALEHPTRRVQCTICGTLGTEGAWYACAEPGCRFILCPKCFDVDECLFGSIQVVIRNPIAVEDNTEAVVYTRPRPSSYKLSPLYAGKLIEVVSSAECKEDRSQVFFRLRTGGWISASQVVCVIPAEPFIESLARLNLQGARAMQVEHASPPIPAVPPRALMSYTNECVALMDDNPPYGIVMAALTMYPVLITVAVPYGDDAAAGTPGTGGRATLPESDNVEADEEEEGQRGGRGRSESAPDWSARLGTEDCDKDDYDDDASQAPVTKDELADELLRFVHCTLHTVLFELANSLDEEAELPIAQNVMLPFYVDLLTGCLLAAHDLSQQWQVTLPEDFVALTLRALTMLARLLVLLPQVHSAPAALRLREPAVMTACADMTTERLRVRQLCRMMTDVAGRLLLCRRTGCPSFGLTDLLPVREQLTFAANEVLEKVFCELVNVAVEADPVHQRRFLDVDPLEIVVRLARSATLAESQLAVLRVVAGIARRSTRNIALMATVVLPALLKMTDAPRSPAVLTAALDCFFELAYAEPARIATTMTAALTSAAAATKHEADMGALSPRRGVSRASLCDPAYTTRCTAIQPDACLSPHRICCFSLVGGMYVSLCEACAQQHPPAGAMLVQTMPLAYLRCQCVICSRSGLRTGQAISQASANETAAATVLNGTMTTAVRLMLDDGLPKLLVRCTKAHVNSAEMLNAIGRILVRVPVPVETAAVLCSALLDKTELTPYAEAALAIASYAHLPAIAEILQREAHSALARYIDEPYCTMTPMKRHVDATPTSSNRMSALGLSPSPNGNSVYRSLAASEVRSSCPYPSTAYPVVDLFVSSLN